MEVNNINKRDIQLKARQNTKNIWLLKVSNFALKIMCKQLTTG